MSDKFEASDLVPLLISLYDSREKDVKRKRDISKNYRDIRGNYKFYGEFGGYLVYQPLDYLASIDLGKNTGWCTSGRYGHGGEADFIPSALHAKSNFHEHTSRINAKLFCFLNPDTFYGEYTLQVFEDAIKIDKDMFFTDNIIHINYANYIIYNYMDDDEYFNNDILDIAKNNLGLDLIIDYDKTNTVDGLEIKDGVIVGNQNKSIENIVIPNYVTSIGEKAFSYCNNLKSVKIPNGVTSIGNDAFTNCTNLSIINLPNSIKSIGDGAFSYCTNLPYIHIPGSVDSIGEFSFSGCNSINRIIIDDGIIRMNNFAFDGCRNVTNVKIPKSISDIGFNVFDSCDKLNSIYYNGDNKNIIDKLSQYADVINPDTKEIIAKKK